MKKRVLMFGTIAVILIMGVIWASGERSEGGITVRTAQAVMGDLQSYLSTTGTVRAQHSVEQYGPQGKVLDVKVKVGDQVKEGDLLVVYEEQDLASAVRQAEVQYENAVLQRDELYAQHQKIKDKIKELEDKINALKAEKVDPSVIESLEMQRDALVPISDERLRQAENAITLAKITLQSARDRMKQNQSVLYAEAKGVVTSVNVAAGAISTGAQPAIIIQDLAHLKVVVSLGRYDAQKVQLGQRAKVRAGGKAYTGEVSFIEPVAKRALTTGAGETTLGIEINIAEENPELKVEFDVDVDILVGEITQGVIVPIESVKLEKGNRNLVYVLKDNVIEEREVTVGLQSTMETEILEGLAPGELVVLNPSNKIAHGVRVTAQGGGGGDAKGK